MTNIFISYSRKDSDFAEQLEQALSAHDKDVWLDVDDIDPGAKWREEIHLGMARCDGIVFVMTPDSLISEECGKELRQAFELGKRVVPVLRREPNGAPVPEEVAAINWVRLRPQDDFNKGVDDLIEALDKDFDWVHEHTRLGVRAAEWEAHSGKGKGAYLLRGADLREAERFLTEAAGKQPAPTTVQLEYVALSRAAERRRNRIMLASVSLALVVAIVLSIVALVERSSAIASQKRAYSRQLAADASTQLGLDPELSVLLASKAYDVNPTAESVSVLRQALVTSQIRMAVRPADGVSQAALTPDGRTLVTAGKSDGVVRLWHYPTGGSRGSLPGIEAARGQMAVNPVDGRVLVVNRLDGHAEVFSGRSRKVRLGSGITAAGWAANGRVIITGGADGSVALWNGLTGRRIAGAHDTNRPISQVALSAHDIYAAALARPGPILIYNLKRRVRYTAPYTCPAGQGKIVLSPDESRLFAFGGAGCDSKLVNLATGRQVGDLSAFYANSAAFSPDGRYLIVASEVAAIVTARDGSGGVAHQYLGHDGIVNGVTFVSGQSGFDVASGGADGMIRIWDSSNPSSTLATLRANMSSVGSVVAATGGRRIVSVDGDGAAARVWATSFPHPTAMIGASVGSAAALSSDGSEAIARDAGNVLGVFDPLTGAEHARLAGSYEVPSLANPTREVGFADGHSFAYELGSGEVKAWRTGDGRGLPGIAVPGFTPRSVAASDRAPVIASALTPTSGTGGRIVTLDPATGRSAVVADARATALAISHNGLELAFAAGRVVTLVDLRTHARRTLIARGGNAPITELAFSGDGQRLAVGGRDFLDVFSVADGQLVGHPFSLPGLQLSSVALSYDGSQVVGGYSDLRARVWTVSDGQLTFTAREPKQPDSGGVVSAVRFSPDGHFLLTSVTPDDTELWDVSTGALLYDFPSPVAGTGTEPAAGWSPGSRLLLTSEGPVQTWTCDVCVGPGALRALARTRVTRGFTAGETSKFLAQ